jgi:hypothetical protein
MILDEQECMESELTYLLSVARVQKHFWICHINTTCKILYSSSGFEHSVMYLLESRDCADKFLQYCKYKFNFCLQHLMVILSLVTGFCSGFILFFILVSQDDDLIYSTILSHTCSFLHPRTLDLPSIR